MTPFTRDSFYAVWVISVIGVCVNGIIGSTPIGTYGSIFDSKDFFFTTLCLASYVLILFVNPSSFLIRTTCFLITFLAIPDAIAQINGAVFSIFNADMDAVLQIPALGLLTINLSLYWRKYKA